MSIYLRDKNIQMLTMSIGIVYLWFGLLKFFPGQSPAEDLAIDTIQRLSFGILPPRLSIVLLATWETIIGAFLLFNYAKKPIILLALVHMVLTFSVFIIFPDLSFNYVPFTLTIIGQYVIKNLVIISGLLIIYPWKPGKD